MSLSTGSTKDSIKYREDRPGHHTQHDHARHQDYPEDFETPRSSCCGLPQQHNRISHGRRSGMRKSRSPPNAFTNLPTMSADDAHTSDYDPHAKKKNSGHGLFSSLNRQAPPSAIQSSKTIRSTASPINTMSTAMMAKLFGDQGQGHVNQGRTPAAVMTLPSRTTHALVATAPNCFRASKGSQWVVAFSPFSTPAATRPIAPVQTDVAHFVVRCTWVIQSSTSCHPSRPGKTPFPVPQGCPGWEFQRA